MLSHQKLKVYGKGLAAATSLILNLAVAYGRTGDRDRAGFLEIAEASAVKAAYLDLCVSKTELPAEEAQAGLDLLSRVVLMLRALSRGGSD